MSPNQVTTRLEFYAKKLIAKGAVARRGPTSGVLPTGMQALDHALWMCQESKQHIADGKIVKVMRWFGFIQGVMWMTGQFTIHEMKEHNREDELVAENLTPSSPAHIQEQVELAHVVSAQTRTLLDQAAEAKSVKVVAMSEMDEPEQP